jgi:hypothetical protein
VVKTPRRGRVVDVPHRGVFGTTEAVHQGLRALGWQRNTSLVERFTLSRRQHVAAMGRRTSLLCKGEAGLRPQWGLSPVSYTFCLPHASFRQALAEPIPTHGSGSSKVGRPGTPAMAASLTVQVGGLRDGLMCRVPPWPQPQTV